MTECKACGNGVQSSEELENLLNNTCPDCGTELEDQSCPDCGYTN